MGILTTRQQWNTKLLMWVNINVIQNASDMFLIFISTVFVYDPQPVPRVQAVIGMILCAQLVEQHNEEQMLLCNKTRCSVAASKASDCQQQVQVH